MQIALVRHGKPEAADNHLVSASGFARWVRRYERSRLRRDSVPPEALSGVFEGHFSVASDRPRSVHSAEVCLGRSPDLRLADLREMEIPRYRMPFWLPAYGWRGRVESFGDAKARARRVSSELHRLARRHGQVVVFGHGLMNRQIARDLRPLGWQGAAWPTGYWGVIQLEWRRR